MHSKTIIPSSIPTTKLNHNHDDDIQSITNSHNSITSHDRDHETDYEDLDQNSHFDQSGIEPDPGCGSENNPPDSFWVSRNKVTDWLQHHTFIERKSSVKLVAVSRKFDPTQPRASQRSVSFNHKPQMTIIGFRQKPGHSSDLKGKQNDNNSRLNRLFKNRSFPGKSSIFQVTEPKSPRVSCIGRVGSMRGRARRTGFWKTVKTALLNRVRKKDRGAPVLYDGVSGKSRQATGD